MDVPSSAKSVADEQDKPQDLSMKSARKVKHIPPPLDLNARTFLDQTNADAKVPKSPGDLPRECLPIRKRHLVEAVRYDDAVSVKSPKSAGPMGDIPSSIRLAPFAAMATSSAVDLTGNGRHTAPSSPLCMASTVSLTPSSATSSLAFTHFPVPPPLIPVPPAASSSAVAAVAMAAAAAAALKDGTTVAPQKVLPTSGFPTPPTDGTSPYAWSAFSPLQLSPFPVPPLVSPAASSAGSREDIDRSDLLKRRVLPSSLMTAGQPTTLSSPLPPASPHWNLRAPSPTWQCFWAGCRVKFLLPNTDAPWQKSEELAWKDHMATKIDARNTYQYAPNGLIFIQSEDMDDPPGDPKKLTRFSPAQIPDAPDIIVEVPIFHPFFVKDKGWCSLNPASTFKKFAAMRCKDLMAGDVCLPPNHPEAVQTPDLCDRFKRFEFSTNSNNADVFFPGSSSPTPIPRPPRAPAAVSPPPMSPVKKKDSKDCDKPKRPMNGFMLFAKKYRLELIQQHPGKDNRAISVLLGEAWKSLPTEERESYSIKAKVMADEQKKIHPDCWKRKKTLSSQNVVDVAKLSSRPNEIAQKIEQPDVV